MEATERLGRMATRPGALGEVARTPSGYNRGRAWDLRRRHARPNSRLVPIARTRQVTVTRSFVEWMFRRTGSTPMSSRAEPCGRFDNDAAGIAELAPFCRSRASGWSAWRRAAATSGCLPAAVGRPACPAPSSMPEACGASPKRWAILEKTDRIDAAVIARFAMAKGLQPTPAAERGPAAAQRPGGAASQVTGDLTVQKQRRSAHA